MINPNKNNGYFLQMPVCDEVLRTEINSDFSLPDYKSEIRRLLCTRVQVMPPKNYVSNNGAQMEGEIVYKMIYVGADSSLYCATLSDKYRFDADFHFDSHSINTDEITLHALCECENLSTRVLGPRKVNVRAKLSCRAFALSPALYQPESIGAHDPSCIEDLVFEAPCLVTRTCESDLLTLNDTVAIDAQIDNIRIINASTSVEISECQASNDRIDVKGEALMKILYCNDAESEEGLVMIRKLPFATKLLCDGLQSSYECCAYATVCEENVSVDENAINIEIIIGIHTLAQRNEDVPYVADSFSTERAVENKLEEINITKGIKAFNGNLTQNEVFMLNDIKLDPDSKVIDADGSARIRSLICENGRATLVGECSYHLICFANGEYSVCEVSAPLKYELDPRAFAGESDVKLINGIANAISTRARCDGERIFIDSELNFCISLKSQYKVSILKERIFGDRITHQKGCMTLCYPKSDATLWDVAKKYSVTPKKLREKNSLSESNDISKKKYLIV